jgi:hypothetical protein
MVTSGRISPAYRNSQTRRQHRSAFTAHRDPPSTSTIDDPRAPGSVVAGLLVVVAVGIGALGYQWLTPSSSTAEGAVPDGTTVFDDDLPGVANLDPALLAALRQAAPIATRDGVTLLVDSGWRSQAYQEQLLREAIAKYGSEAEAARWVATPETSAHVSGDAVDVGPAAAASWLARHGAAYGLCRTYGNEPWHFELRPGAAAHGCPAMYADPAHDPRMQR